VLRELHEQELHGPIVIKGGADEIGLVVVIEITSRSSKVGVVVLNTSVAIQANEKMFLGPP
jgi:hypothetical protein